MTELSVEITVQRGGVTVLTVGGEIDWTNSDQFSNAVSDALAQRTAVVDVDLTAVAFMNSVGLAILLAGYRQAREAGVAYKVRTNSNLALLLQRTGTAEILGVHPPRA